ncbi:unnamed protein product [Rodentolepis nana]|uniref:Uncharacterized protein n=1 Tax=Rodentolepis nana TaxID=102285 RepID=A0A0R3THF9_RODNA|nr:unnamed protein product [Rodentolepis nana]
MMVSMGKSFARLNFSGRIVPQHSYIFHPRQVLNQSRCIYGAQSSVFCQEFLHEQSSNRHSEQSGSLESESVIVIVTSVEDAVYVSYREVQVGQADGQQLVELLPLPKEDIERLEARLQSVEEEK